MFVNRPERSATIAPNFCRSKPVSQNGERGNLVQTTIGFSLIEDEWLIGLAEVGEWYAIRECPPFRHKAVSAAQLPQEADRGDALSRT